MSKSDDRRAAILELLADHVLAEGVAAASLRPLARAAGLSDRMLLYYFKDKPELMAATLERLAERLAALLGAEVTRQRLPFDILQPRLFAILSTDALWPYMRIWLEVVALSARGDPFFGAIGERIGRGFLAWGEAQLDSPDPGQRAADAARLLALTDGMLLLKAVGLGEIFKPAAIGS